VASPERAPASCECPWSVVTRCNAGCVADDLEVLASDDGGAAQLCRPTEPVLRPILAGDPSPPAVCAEEGLRCVDGVLVECKRGGTSARYFAVCLYGCEQSVALPGPFQTGAEVGEILCRRAHAERQ
jgi:hypothetical protein